MKNIKIVAITIAIIFSVIYALNLEYFIKGIRVVYLNYGNWNGNQIIDSAFVKSSMKPFLDDFDAYGIGLWLKKHKGLNVSLMSGHQGQYVIMIPEKELIITRLGQRDIDLGGPGVSGDVLTYIDEALKLIID